MTDVRVALVTVPDEATGVELSRTLVEERLVACGNLLGGVRSIFRWEGRVDDETECLVILKTSESRIPALLRRVAEIHPYDVPEVLVLKVDAGHRDYLEWVAAETRSAPDRSPSAGP